MLAIIDYGVGNLTSIQNMFKKAGVEAKICRDKAEIQAAQKILLPGMGSFDNCMNRFNQSGFRELIERKVLEDKMPLLGICVGLQMLTKSSEEGQQLGLGWIKGKTIGFDKLQMQELHKIPNMGWLEIKAKKESPLLSNLQDARFYFAHSYHVVPEDESDTLITTDYGYAFTAGVEKGNILGVQFHPEKSHRFGMQLFKNFATNY
jgi:glutamine amidotransferase